MSFIRNGYEGIFNLIIDKKAEIGEEIVVDNRIPYVLQGLLEWAK